MSIWLVKRFGKHGEGKKDMFWAEGRRTASLGGADPSSPSGLQRFFLR